MSRVGKKPIIIPENVKIKFDKNFIIIEGNFGILKKQIPEILIIKQDLNYLKLYLKNKVKNSSSIHGLYRTLIANMIIGVSKKFFLVLILKGIGYRAFIEKNKIILNLGYTHSIKIDIPENISINIEQNIKIQLSSIDKEKLGAFAAQIRSYRIPELYKGKGILYENEKILLKTVKTKK
uniref:Ribosomal protein L6 n=1 Tax=Nitzschia sp. NIES-3576 TaxID=2083273 RepID=A0A2Z5ZBA0_9STRA|nr:ribosomal protein L6 [Nitzschia sp. NIES-3576]